MSLQEQLLTLKKKSIEIINKPTKLINFNSIEDFNSNGVEGCHIYGFTSDGTLVIVLSYDCDTKKFKTMDVSLRYMREIEIDQMSAELLLMIADHFSIYLGIE